jgi:5'-phosphate synthase pdxT subunit
VSLDLRSTHGGGRAPAAPRIGVLALQGDFAAHARALEEAGAQAREVRNPPDLPGLDGLVIPGGESTALLKLMEPERLDEAIREFEREGGALFGTCAGLILLASRVENPPQASLGLIDLTVERNAYGRQIDSFVGRGRVRFPGEPETHPEMVFIRAPRIRSLGPGGVVLGEFDGEPVLAQAGRVLVATFHPEMSRENRVHAYFVRLAAASASVRPSDPAGAVVRPTWTGS